MRKEVTTMNQAVEALARIAQAGWGPTTRLVLIFAALAGAALIIKTVGLYVLM
jgi:hypothetical protein